MHRHLLIVDDDEDIRDLVKESLSLQDGWSVSLAASGEEGVNMAAIRPPDVMLLDFAMPGMDGTATLHALRAHPRTRHIPVILMTANPRGEDLQAFMSSVAGVIAKPFDPYGLAHRIVAILGWEA